MVEFDGPLCTGYVLGVLESLRRMRERGLKEACMTGGLVPRMRRLRGVAGSFTYYLLQHVINPLSSPLLFSLLRAFAKLPLWPSFLQDCCFVAVGAAFGASFGLWRRPVLGLWGVLCWLRSSPFVTTRQPISSKRMFVHFYHSIHKQ